MTGWMYLLRLLFLCLCVTFYQYSQQSELESTPFSEYKKGLTMLRREARSWKPTSRKTRNSGSSGPELGSLPADSQQDLLIEFMSSQLEHMQEEMESMMSNSVNIKRAQQDIERLLNDVEKLKDKLRESNGGN
jgi:cysteinyl-tRNA synthetase